MGGNAKELDDLFTAITGRRGAHRERELVQEA